MKKSIMTIVCLTFCIINVNAKCNNEELLRWQEDLKINIVDAIEGEKDQFYLVLNNPRTDITATVNNTLWPGTVYTAKTYENGMFGIGTTIDTTSNKYTFNIYMKKDAKACAGEKIAEVSYTVAPYNKYSKTAFCEDNPTHELCAPLKDTSNITNNEFIKIADEYINGSNKPTKSSVILTIIEYILWIAVPALVIYAIYEKKIKKIRGEKENA